MSHFYASATGNRSTTTRTGTKASGITAHARGWDIGGEVACRNTSKGDHVDIGVTCGSNSNGRLLDLGTFIHRGTERPQAAYGPVSQLATVTRDILNGDLTPELVAEAQRLVDYFLSGK